MERSRRDFLKLGCQAAAGGFIALTARGLLPGESATSAEASGTDDYSKYDPTAHEWAFVVDTTKCIGCGRCARACKAENNVPLEPGCNRTWIERYRLREGQKPQVDSPDGGFNGFLGSETAAEVSTASAPAAGGSDATGTPSEGQHGPVERSFFVPKLCNQCEKPPCVQVCPVGATYRTADGIILVNQDKCIGCRYCIQACPYGARYLVPDGDRSPTGQVRVADKCTWCYHRITRGLKPACVEACPVSARQFGDLKDEKDPLRALFEHTRFDALKPELGTKPRVKYIGLDEEVV